MRVVHRQHLRRPSGAAGRSANSDVGDRQRDHVGLRLPLLSRPLGERLRLDLGLDASERDDSDRAHERPDRHRLDDRARDSPHGAEYGRRRGAHDQVALRAATYSNAIVAGGRCARSTAPRLRPPFPRSACQSRSRCRRAGRVSDAIDVFESRDAIR